MKEHTNKRENGSEDTGKTINDGCGSRIQSLQKEKRINDLTKILTTINKKINTFESEYAKTSCLIMDMEDFFDAEKKQLNEYRKKIQHDNSAEMSGSKKRITAHDIYDHSRYIQDTLEEMDRNRQHMCSTLASLANKFSEEEVRMAYNAKSNKFCFLFQKIYDDILDIAFEQRQLVKKIR